MTFSKRQHFEIKRNSFVQVKRKGKPEIHRYGTLKSLHPAFRFQNNTILSGHKFAGSFAGSAAGSDHGKGRGGPDIMKTRYWPGATPE